MSKQPTERTAVGRMLDLPMMKEQGAEPWDSKDLRNMASGKRRAQVPVSTFLEPSKGDGATASFSRQETAMSWRRTSPPASFTPRALPQAPNLPISGTPLPKAVVCTKEAIRAFLLQTVYFYLPSKKGTSTDNWTHLSYQSFPHHKLVKWSQACCLKPNGTYASKWMEEARILEQHGNSKSRKMLFSSCARTTTDHTTVS